MIEKLFHRPHLLHQTCGKNEGVPNFPIAGSLDGGGTIVLSQEGRHICVNRASIPELCKLLKTLATLEVK